MKWMPLRYKGKCKVCGDEVPDGTIAYYDSANKTVTCGKPDCLKADGLEIGNNVRVGPPAPIPPRTTAPRIKRAYKPSTAPAATSTATAVAVAEPVAPAEAIDLGGIPPEMALRCPCCQRVFTHECVEAGE